jgi:hypothetical protein
VPLLKSPVASARSRRGNQYATVLIAAGKFADSPMPSAKRATLNCSAFPASAWAMAATLQTTTASK